MNKTQSIYSNLLEQKTTLFRIEYVTNPLGLRELLVHSTALAANHSLVYNADAIANSLEQLAKMIRENRQVALFVNGHGLTLDERFSNAAKKYTY